MPAYGTPEFDALVRAAAGSTGSVNGQSGSTFSSSGSGAVTYAPPTTYNTTSSNSNPNNSYLNEILYSKNLWEKGSSGTGATDGEKSWAEANAKSYYDKLSPADAAKIREMDASQLSNYINSQNQPTGGSNYTGPGVIGQPPLPTQPTPPKEDPQMKAWMDMINKLNGQVSQYQTGFNNIMNQMNGQNAAAEAKRKAEADALAQKQYDEGKLSLENLIKNLKTGQGNELDAINGSINNAIQSIEDQTFQKWLQTRQNAANAGLGGSGLAKDANTRLLLAKQKDLANMFTQKQQNIADVNNRYGSKLTEAQQGMSKLNLTDLQKQAFSDLTKSGNSTLMEQAKLYADLIGKTIGYDKLKPSEILDSYDKNIDRSEKSKQFYDKMDNETQLELLNLGFKYDELDAKSQQFYDKLNSEEVRDVVKMEKDYGFKMMELMGVDQNGNPTLDARKFLADVQLKQADLSEKIRHNRVSEGLSAQSNTISAARLQETIRNNQANLKAKVEQQEFENRTGLWKDQANMLLGVADDKAKAVDIVAKQIDQYKDANGKIAWDHVPDSLSGKYRDVIKEYDAAVLSVELVANNKTRPAGSAPLNGGLTNNGGGR